MILSTFVLDRTSGTSRSASCITQQLTCYTCEDNTSRDVVVLPCYCSNGPWERSCFWTWRFYPPLWLIAFDGPPLRELFQLWEPNVFPVCGQIWGGEWQIGDWMRKNKLKLTVCEGNHDGRAALDPVGREAICGLTSSILVPFPHPMCSNQSKSTPCNLDVFQLRAWVPLAVYSCMKSIILLPHKGVKTLNQGLETKKVPNSCLVSRFVLCLLSANAPCRPSQHPVLRWPLGDLWPDDQWKLDILHYLRIRFGRLYGGQCSGASVKFPSSQFPHGSPVTQVLNFINTSWRPTRTCWEVHLMNLIRSLRSC